MNEPIKNKVVVITGASSGLGEAAARRLAQRGAKLVLAARRMDRLKALAGELSLGTDAVVKTDVTEYSQVKQLVDHAAQLHVRDEPAGRSGYQRNPLPAHTPGILGGRKCELAF